MVYDNPNPMLAFNYDRSGSWLYFWFSKLFRIELKHQDLYSSRPAELYSKALFYAVWPYFNEPKRQASVVAHAWNLGTSQVQGSRSPWVGDYIRWRQGRTLNMFEGITKVNSLGKWPYTNNLFREKNWLILYMRIFGFQKQMVCDP